MENNDRQQDKHPDPMNTDRKVDNSKDHKTDEDFPGYPHYPASDDIMKNEEKISMSDANFANPQPAENQQDFPKKEILRDELDNESDRMPGKKEE